MSNASGIGTGNVRCRRPGRWRAAVRPSLLLMLIWYAQTGAQSIYTVTAPLSDGSSSALRVPNGTIEHAFQRTVTLVDAPSFVLVPLGTKITRLGFVLIRGAGVKVTGNMKIYMSKSASMAGDLTMSWSAILGGMTQVYSGPFTIPDTAGVVDLTLSTPFQYTGRSMYVAYEFQSTGPFSTQYAIFSASTALRSMTRSGFSTSALPEVLSDISDYRPVLRFGFPIPPVQWNKIASGIQADLSGLDIADDFDAWACSPAGNMYWTNDVGKNWYETATVPDSVHTLLGLAGNVALAVGGKESLPSSLYLVSNSDSSCTKLTDPALNVRIGIAGKTSSQSLWFLGTGVSDTAVLLTCNIQGKYWSRLPTGVVLNTGVRISRGSGFRLGNTMWFGTCGSGSTSGAVYRSATGPGGPWRSYPTGRANVAVIGFSSATGTGLAAHAGCIDTIRRSTDGGMTWSPVVSAGLGEVASLQFFAGGQDAWAATSTGIWRTSDDGLTWQRSYALGSSSQSLSSVRFYPNFQSGLAVGSGGFIAKANWAVTPILGVSESPGTPSEYWLGLNYPNPFNSSTWIEYSVPWQSIVAVTVIDLLGREVATIFSGQQGPGRHKLEWNAGKCPSGVYFYRLHASPSTRDGGKDFTETRKLILLK